MTRRGQFSRAKQLDSWQAKEQLAAAGGGDRKCVIAVARNFEPAGKTPRHVFIFRFDAQIKITRDSGFDWLELFHIRQSWPLALKNLIIQTLAPTDCSGCRLNRFAKQR